MDCIVHDGHIVLRKTIVLVYNIDKKITRQPSVNILNMGEFTTLTVVGDGFRNKRGRETFKTFRLSASQAAQ